MSKHSLGRGPWLAALAAIVAVTVGARPARAQVPERVYVGIEAGAGTLLSSPQRDEFGLGITGRMRVGFRPVRALGIHLSAEGSRWSPVVETNRNAVSWTFGGGLRLTPFFLGRGGRLFVDVDAGAAFTGDPVQTRFGLGAGIGWLFPIGRYFHIGPEVRYGHVFGTADDDAAGRGDAVYWNAGLAIELAFPGERPAPPPAPPPPPADTDGDGILDPDDRCVSEPETRNDYQDADGCPDNPDTDGDGIRDPDDRCISEPEDRDQYLDEDGCPELDNDSDGVPDATDRCPLQPEVVNQFQDEDGCPDEAPATATVSAERISINQHVFFDTDRATIQARSNAILDQVVAALRDHPEITRVRIEGNADDTGDAGHNRTLSRDRARSVMRYLQNAGIAARRMTAIGNGSDRPAMQGDTEEAHARNRRVEFVIEPAAATSARPRAGRRRRR